MIFPTFPSQGTKTTTVYTWEFHDGKAAASEQVTGFKDTKTHSFNTKGAKVVKVTAKNSEGEATASVRLLVEGELENGFNNSRRT